MAIMLGGKVSFMPTNGDLKLKSEQDPPALTMTWAIWEMARNPAVYQRVRAEVASM